MVIGILAMGAVNNFITAEFILGIAVLNNPSYVITRWQTTLVAYSIAFMALAFNVFVPQLLHRVRFPQTIFVASSDQSKGVQILPVLEHFCLHCHCCDYLSLQRSQAER